MNESRKFKLANTGSLYPRQKRLLARLEICRRRLMNLLAHELKRELILIAEKAIPTTPPQQAGNVNTEA